MLETKLLEKLKKHPFLLAPMAGITDRIFRLFMKKQGAGIVTSEFVSAKALTHNNEKTKKMTEFFEEERPVGIQIFGQEPKALIEAAQFVEQSGADFVDINLGCPVKKIVRQGAGCALLKEPEKLKKILRGIKNKIQIPLTLKIRTGWDQENRNASDIVRLAWDEGVTWVTIHGRTRSQAYTGKADWDYITRVKTESPIPIIGNGDIISAEKAVDLLKKSGCNGVMIGRGCLKNPWIFQQSLKLLKDQSEKVLSWNYLPLFEFIRVQGEKFSDQKHSGLLLKKLATWYSSGLPGASEFRQSVFSARSLDEIFNSIVNYYSDLHPKMRKDTSHQAFLMGGHG